MDEGGLFTVRLADPTPVPIVANGFLTAVADRRGDVGALVGLDLETLDPELRVEGVPCRTVRTSAQAYALYWPRPGVIYAVRTPGREGLWVAYPNL